MTKTGIIVAALVEQEDGYEVPIWVSFAQSVVKRLSIQNRDIQLDFHVVMTRDMAADHPSLFHRLAGHLGDFSAPRQAVLLASPFFSSLGDHLALAHRIRATHPDCLVIYGGKIATLQTQTARGLTSLRAPSLLAAARLLRRGNFKGAFRTLAAHRPLIDLIVRGDAENTFELVVRGIIASQRKGSEFRRHLSKEWSHIHQGLAYFDPVSKTTVLQQPPPAPTSEDLDRVYSQQDYSTADSARTALVFGGEGTCPFRCVFCLEHSTGGPNGYDRQPLRERSMAKVAAELDQRLAAGQRVLLVVDSMWHGHSRVWKDEFVHFFEERSRNYAGVTLKIFGHIRYVARDYSLIQRLALVTKLSYFVGIENINQRILDKLRKDITSAEIQDALARLRNLKNLVGVRISIAWGYIMVSPWDDFETIKASCDFLHEHRMMSSIVHWGNSLGIFPTNPMLQALAQDDLLLRDHRFAENLSLQGVILQDHRSLAKYAHGQLIPPNPRRPFDSDLYRLARFLSKLMTAQMKSETQRLLHQLAEDETKALRFEQVLMDLNDFNRSMFQLFLAEIEGNWRFLSNKAWRKRARFLEALYLHETATHFMPRLEALIGPTA